MGPRSSDLRSKPAALAWPRTIRGAVIKRPQGHCANIGYIVSIVATFAGNFLFSCQRKMRNERPPSTRGWSGIWSPGG